MYNSLIHVSESCKLYHLFCTLIYALFVMLNNATFANRWRLVNAMARAERIGAGIEIDFRHKANTNVTKVEQYQILFSLL